MSDFKTYWDLEEEERARLTSAEVERFLDAELMTRGVLKVSAMTLDPEPEIVEPESSTYYQVGPIAFHSAESAEAFLKLAPVSIDTKYLAGNYRSSVCVAVPFDRDVTEKRLVSESEFAARKSDLERRAAVRDANQKRSEEHQRASKEQDKVLDGVWEDWHRCRNVDQTHRKVVATFSDYVRTAGDELTAARFLGKVFTFEQIDEARKWCGVSIPDADNLECIQVRPAPLKATEEDLSF